MEPKFGVAGNGPSQKPERSQMRLSLRTEQFKRVPLHLLKPVDLH
jgi:hypothetical protein